MIATHVLEFVIGRRSEAAHTRILKPAHLTDFAQLPGPQSVYVLDCQWVVEMAQQRATQARTTLDIADEYVQVVPSCQDQRTLGSNCAA